MADDPLPHTKSEGLKRLLRRRGRRGKVGANTGEKVYGWAEYSQTNFTPSGDRSSIFYGLIVALFVFALVLVPILIGATDAVIQGENFLGFVRYILGALINGVLYLAFFGAPVALIAWIYIRLDGNGKKDTERLIAAADKLREKRAEAQDEDANRAR